MGAVIDSQVKGDHAVTSGSVLLGIGGLACAGRVSYAMPCVLITCCLGLDASIAVVNSQA